jgi:hypothetical protein
MTKTERDIRLLADRMGLKIHKDGIGYRVVNTNRDKNLSLYGSAKEIAYWLDGYAEGYWNVRSKNAGI